MFCPNCGKEIPENIKFCNYCGAEQSIISSSASFQETPQQQQYNGYVPQQQPVMDAKIKTASRFGGFGLIALSVFSILMYLVWHLYDHLVHYVGLGDVVVILIQSCMVVGGILMICMPIPKAVLQVAGIVLLALSTLSIFVCFRSHVYSPFITFITSRELLAVGENIAAAGFFGLLLIQYCMIVVGILMIYISGRKKR